MSVRKAIDELTSEPPVGDLGYAADQRQVAVAMLGMQLLADELDEVKRRLADLARPTAPAQAVGPPQDDDAVDVGSQLDELTDQLRKLTKAVNRASKKKGR